MTAAVKIRVHETASIRGCFLYLLFTSIKGMQNLDSWEAFYEETGWERDNPECADKKYLKNNRICQEIGNEVWYFSQFKWDE